MNSILMVVGAFIAKLAELGAGFMSIGTSYAPEVPEELRY